jgi:hypothetical protein
MGSNHHFRNYDDLSIWKDHHDQYEFKHSIIGPNYEPGLFEWKFDYHHNDFNHFIDKVNLLRNLDNDEPCVILWECRDEVGEIIRWKTNQDNPLVQNLIRKLKNKQSNIIFFNCDVGHIYNKGNDKDLEDPDWGVIKLFLEKHDISSEQITIVGPDKYVIKEDRHKLHNEGIEFCNFNRQAAYQKVYNFDFYRNFNNVVKSTKPFLRQKKYLCLNNSTRGHRADIFTFLHQSGFIDDGYLSYGSYYGDTGPNNLLSAGILSESQIEDVWHDFKDLKYLKSQIEETFKLVPRLVDKKRNWTENFNGDIGTVINSSLYMNSYFNIVTETDFDMNWRDIQITHITEKTIKPIHMMHPFIIVGPYKTLEVLRDFGFKTFHPYIDESYDKEIDPEKRMKMIKKEISNLCSKSIEELDIWYWKMYDILEYNYKHLSVHSRKQITDLIKLLEKKWENLIK